MKQNHENRTSAKAHLMHRHKPLGIVDTDIYPIAVGLKQSLRQIGQIVFSRQRIIVRQLRNFIRRQFQALNRDGQSL